MKVIKHKSASANHYQDAALNYDLLNEENSKIINQTIEEILRKRKVQSVLDMTCGTGSQVFWLHQKGFQVVGSDFNSRMLTVAKQKAKAQKKTIRFLKGDMRNTQVGLFDAVISIFNAVGHLSRSDFQKAMFNVSLNLNSGGFYLFDIFNLNFLLSKNNITQLTIDWQKREKGRTVREIQYSIIDEEGILASYTVSSVKQHAQTLQVYTRSQLKNMLEKAGFTLLSVTDVDGSIFYEKKTQRMLVLAKKR